MDETEGIGLILGLWSPIERPSDADSRVAGLVVWRQHGPCAVLLPREAWTGSSGVSEFHCGWDTESEGEECVDRGIGCLRCIVAQASLAVVSPAQGAAAGGYSQSVVSASTDLDEVVDA